MAKKLEIEAWWDGSRLKRGVDEAKGSIQSLDNVLKGAFAGATTAVLVAGLKSLYLEAMNDVTVMEKLANSVKRVGGATGDIKAVQNTVTNLTLSTGIAEEEIQAAFQRMVVTTGDLHGALKNLPLALDLMTARTVDGAAAGQMMAMAMKGEITALSILMPDVKEFARENKNLAGEAQSADFVLKLMFERMGGMAKENANTASGSMRVLTNAVSEWKEAVTLAILGEHNWVDIHSKLAEKITASKGPLEWYLKTMRAIHTLWTGTPKEAIKAFSDAWGLGKKDVGLPEFGLPGGFYGRKAEPAPAREDWRGLFPKEWESRRSTRLAPGKEEFGAGSWAGLELPYRGIRTEELERWKGDFGSDKALKDRQRINEKWLEDLSDSIRKEREQMLKMQSDLTRAFYNIFQAARGGWSNLMDYMREQLINKVLSELASGLASAMVPGGGGIIGGIFGSILGGSNSGGGSIMGDPGVGPIATRYYGSQGAIAKNLSWKGYR